MNNGSPDDTRYRIVEILSESVRCALGLKETLTDEREALERRDTVSLNTAAASKATLIRQLAKLNETRGEISEQAGFGSSTANMEALAEWCDDDLLVTNCWQHFREIAGECDLLNKTNGAIIHLRRQQILEGLSVLRGDQRDANTYAPAGSATNGMAGRALTEA
jgi:flagellar biosynthesis/type III secretory pathway chaperone